MTLAEALIGGGTATLCAVGAAVVVWCLLGLLAEGDRADRIFALCLLVPLAMIAAGSVLLLAQGQA